MVAAELSGLLVSFDLISPRGHLQRDLTPGSQRIRMVGTQHPQLSGQDIPELGLSPSVLSQRRHLPGDVVSGR